MELRNLIYKLRKRINLQFLKHTWLDLKRDKAKAIFGISGIAISLFLLKIRTSLLIMAIKMAIIGKVTNKGVSLNARSIFYC